MDRASLRNWKVKINRAPVMTLWAAVVAERLGFDWKEAITLDRGVAGLNAQSKGRRLGIFEPAEEKGDKSFLQVLLLGQPLNLQFRFQLPKLSIAGN